MNHSSPEFFDPQAKEAQLQHESQSWDTSQVQAALPGDIPEIDVAEYFTTQGDAALDAVAVQLRSACQETGFCSIVGHQFPSSLIKRAFSEARRFFALPLDIKNTLMMDRPNWPVKAVGYLAVNNYKLPARDKGNLNETFVIKRDHQVGLADNQWPNEDQLPEFRANTEHYAGQMENLAKRLLPIYARALDLDKNFFAPAFTKPLYRLRMTHYPLIEDKAADEFGIAPHVDTTFFTLLAQNSPGLVIFSEKRRCWIHAPVNESAFIVNTGELLKQWSNDFFISVKHFANNNTGDEARYSIPFFFNANPDYKMECLPTCCSAENPPKYPPISYLQSQGVVQGE
ncbi:MAG: isopenicillin N synthase family oxygenase [Proteobacteria bacterium]|nr:isopenicillin N synthase family oxygenase [Pseudomonadota bacterium]